MKKPKYVFLFIGDGMSHTQVNAAQVYNGTVYRCRQRICNVKRFC